MRNRFVIAMVALLCGAGHQLVQAQDNNGVRLVANSKRSGVLLDLCISRDGALAISADNGTINLWDANLGRLIRAIDVGAATYSVAISPDNRQIWAGTDEAIHLFDSETGK